MYRSLSLFDIGVRSPSHGERFLACEGEISLFPSYWTLPIACVHLCSPRPRFHSRKWVWVQGHRSDPGTSGYPKRVCGDMR